MSKWIYDGYTKVHDRKHMIEKWCYKCSACGYVVRTEPRRKAIEAFTKCPSCSADMVGESERG